MSLSVLGVGLPRTGTVSLVKALGILGLRAIHFHPERLIDVAARGDWRVYEDMDAAADFPAAPFYRQILAAYPAARCVLTMREPREEWIDSVLGHGRAMFAEIQDDGYHSFMEKVGRAWWGDHVAPISRRALADCYQRWLARVQADIPADRLLVLDVCGGDGWGPLCRFLGRPAPSLPFPRENRRNA